MVSLQDPQFGVALEDLFCRLHTVTTSIFCPLFDEFLQKWYRSRKVYSMSSETKDVIVKQKPKKKSRTTKAKEDESDNITDTDNSDDDNQVSDNEVANVRKHEN